MNYNALWTAVLNRGLPRRYAPRNDGKELTPRNDEMG